MTGRRFLPALSALEARLALDGAPDTVPLPPPTLYTGTPGPDGLPVPPLPAPDTSAPTAVWGDPLLHVILDALDRDQASLRLTQQVFLESYIALFTGPDLPSVSPRPADTPAVPIYPNGGNPDVVLDPDTGAPLTDPLPVPGPVFLPAFPGMSVESLPPSDVLITDGPFVPYVPPPAPWYQPAVDAWQWFRQSEPTDTSFWVGLGG